MLFSVCRERCRIVIACVSLVCAPFAVSQPIDVRIDRDPSVEDYDFSWVYWFETHGPRYVREAVGDRALPWDTPASRRWRGSAIEALMPMLDDGEPAVRAAAIVSLARIGHADLLARVLPGEAETASLLLDPSGDVRLSAWIAMGLLQADASRAALGVAPLDSAEEIDRVGQAVAIGLLDELDRVHAMWLIDRLDAEDESLEVKRWCVWAMSRHDDASLDPVFAATLDGLPSTFAIVEVLMNSGHAQRRGGPTWLVDVLRYHPKVRDWAGYRALGELDAAGLSGSTPRRLAMETRVAAALSLAEQPLMSDVEDQRFVLLQLRRRMVPGNTAQAMDFNRGFDTLAYFMHCAGTQADRDLLYDQLRGFTTLRSDDPGVLAQLEEGAEPTEADLFVRQPDNEVRCYAALSAGLLIRRATEGTRLHDERPIIAQRAIEIERLKRRFGVRLMRAVANSREPITYRAACAIALGLTGDERYAEELAIELSKLRAGDEAVLGYGLLALAMLGEDRIVDPATRYLTRPGRVEGIGDLLGRRAALRALAVAGESQGDTLAQCWGRNRWVSLHAAEAAAWSGRYDAVPAMINALSSESVAWRAIGAASLGRVFDASWPSRLAGLVEGSNPTLSLRPQRDATRDAVIDAENQLAPPWPMARVYALGDPFYVAMKQGRFDAPPATDDQPAR
jgi:hypothetical protein